MAHSRWTRAVCALCTGCNNLGVGPLTSFAAHHEGDQRTAEQRAESLALITAAVRAADEKLAHNIVVLDVAEQLSVIDYFLVASGRNARQVATIAEEIEAATKKATGRGPEQIEGLRDATWILMDYGEVVFHVFLDETREYYDLEHLWSGVPRLDTAAMVHASSTRS